jgi:hypothetical protein
LNQLLIGDFYDLTISPFNESPFPSSRWSLNRKNGMAYGSIGVWYCHYSITPPLHSIDERLAHEETIVRLVGPRRLVRFARRARGRYH